MENKIYIFLNKKQQIEKICFDVNFNIHYVYFDFNKEFISTCKKNNFKPSYNKIIYLNDSKKTKKIINFFMSSNFTGYLKFETFINKFNLEEWAI